MCVRRGCRCLRLPMPSMLWSSTTMCVCMCVSLVPVDSVIVAQAEQLPFVLVVVVFIELFDTGEGDRGELEEGLGSEEGVAPCLVHGADALHVQVLCVFVFVFV